MKKKTDSPLAEALTKKAAASGKQRFVLRLYVAGITPQSSRAIQNITQICEDNLRDGMTWRSSISTSSRHWRPASRSSRRRP
jgi:hypothetical protein